MFDRQTYLKQTGEAPTEKIVVLGESTVAEYRDGKWQGPFDCDVANIREGDTIEAVGKLSSEQYLKLCQTLGVVTEETVDDNLKLKYE